MSAITQDSSSTNEDSDAASQNTIARENGTASVTSTSQGLERRSSCATNGNVAFNHFAPRIDSLLYQAEVSDDLDLDNFSRKHEEGMNDDVCILPCVALISYSY